MKLNLSPANIHQMSVMPFNDAVKYALTIIDSADIKNSVDEMKLARFRQNISSKRNTMQLTKMFYDIILSGEGLGVSNSAWSKQYGKSKGKKV